MAINIDSSEQSRARLRLQPTPRRTSSASPDLWGWTPPRSTSRVGLRLARHRGRGLCLARHQGRGLHLAQPLGEGSSSPDTEVTVSASPDL